MVSYEGYLVDLEVDSTRLAIDKIRSHADSAELTTINADPIYATVACEAALQEPIEASFAHITYIRSLVGALLDAYQWSLIHYKMDYLRSWEGVELLPLIGLPASEFGYLRTITMLHNGKPVPFLKTVLDSDIPTGLLTASKGKSTTVLQRLKYTAKAARVPEQFLSDEIDLTGAVPPELEVSVRRIASAKLNRKKIR